MSDENVSEKICAERTQRIEEKMASIEEHIMTSIDALDSTVQVVIESHKEILERHEGALSKVGNQAAENSELLVSFTQWKTNGEKRKDVWYKHQNFRIGLLVLLLTMATNSDKIGLALKGILAILNGGKP